MFLHCPCLHSAFDNAGPQLYTECATSHHIYCYILVIYLS